MKIRFQLVFDNEDGTEPVQASLLDDNKIGLSGPLWPRDLSMVQELARKCIDRGRPPSLGDLKCRNPVNGVCRCDPACNE